MLKTIFLICVAFLSGIAHADPDLPWKDSRQMIVITSSDWNSTFGKMQRYAKIDDKSGWQADGMPLPVMLGKTGMAWGKGLHPAIDEAPQKHEGDKRIPAGIFQLSSGFGYADKSDEAIHSIKFPYIAATASTECIDDPNSSLYNRIADRVDVPAPDWSSSEKLRRNDELYRWGIVVNQNPDNVPGAGSCVFMHVWRAPGRPTVGCSAMALEDIRALLGWLNPIRKPILVQLPEKEYERRKAAWQLP